MLDMNFDAASLISSGQTYTIAGNWSSGFSRAPGDSLRREALSSENGSHG